MIPLILSCIVGFFAGILSSMGLGAGTILILYFSIFTQIPQETAQGINLIFFIPIGLFSIYLHKKNGILTYHSTFVKISALGILGAILGATLVGFLNPSLLQKLFAFFLLFIGCKDLLQQRISK